MLFCKINIQKKKKVLHDHVLSFTDGLIKAGFIDSECGRKWLIFNKSVHSDGVFKIYMKLN